MLLPRRSEKISSFLIFWCRIYFLSRKEEEGEGAAHLPSSRPFWRKEQRRAADKSDIKLQLPANVNLEAANCTADGLNDFSAEQLYHRTARDNEWAVKWEKSSALDPWQLIYLSSSSDQNMIWPGHGFFSYSKDDRHKISSGSKNWVGSGPVKRNHLAVGALLWTLTDCSSYTIWDKITLHDCNEKGLWERIG